MQYAQLYAVIIDLVFLFYVTNFFYCIKVIPVILVNISSLFSKSLTAAIKFSTIGPISLFSNEPVLYHDYININTLFKLPYMSIVI